MAQSFTKVTQETFDWSGLAQNITTNAGTETIQIMNRYSNLAETHQAIENFDAINMGLTPIYAMDDNAGKKISWNLDKDTLGGSNRDPYDRYIWSGEVSTTGGDSSFRSSTIDGVDTDGFMYIPQPFQGNPGNQYESSTYSEQGGISINLQYNNLAAHQWVPLFGLALGWGGTLQEWVGQNSSIWQHSYEMYGANYPWAAAGDDVNLYNRKSDDSKVSNPYSYFYYGLQYYMYCHDGNGNAMIATAAGEAATDNSAAYADFPTNEHYNSTNGYLKFAAPYLLRDWMTTQNNPLQSLWDEYSSALTHPQASKMAWVDKRTYMSTPDSGGGWADSFAGSLGELVAYGPTTNADLSSPTNIFIATNKIADSTYGRYGRFQAGRLTNQAHADHRSTQLFTTGKIGDFTFTNVHGPARQYVRNGVASYGVPVGLILRPGVVGEGQINSASYGAFISDPHPSGFFVPAGNSLEGSFAIGPDVEYIFPTEGSSYDPIVAASSNSAMLTDSSGVAMNTLADPSWDDTDFLVDDVLSTKSTIKKSGADNALYIGLNSAPATMTASNTDPITDFVITVRGVTQVILGNYSIMAAITKSDRSEIVRTSASEAITAPLKGSSSSNPGGGGQYTIHFQGADMSGYTYADIKDGFIKIWAELG